MSERAPYSRVYHGIVDDPKFVDVYDDDRRLATWLRLLIVAEQAHPASAYIPAGTNRAALAALVEAELIDLGTGSRFRIHGLDAERTRRTEAARVAGLASGRSRAVQRTSNDRSTEGQLAETSIDEQRQDETSQAEQTRTRPKDDLWSDPEWEALVWLQRHGCDVRPGNGFHQRLITGVERHGVNAVVGMLDRLADAGTKNGDLKGFVFGAIDALDQRTRPNLKALEAEDRAEEREDDFRRRVARTRERTAELRGVLNDG